METRRFVPFLLILSGFLYFVLRDQQTSPQVDEPEEAIIAMVQALNVRVPGLVEMPSLEQDGRLDGQRQNLQLPNTTRQSQKLHGTVVPAVVQREEISPSSAPAYASS